MNTQTTDIILTDRQTKAHYDQFITELTRLSSIYGVAIQSVGGVSIARRLGEFEEMTYRADISSGDLYPILPE